MVLCSYSLRESVAWFGHRQERSGRKDSLQIKGTVDLGRYFKEIPVVPVRGFREFLLFSLS